MAVAARPEATDRLKGAGAPDDGQPVSRDHALPPTRQSWRLDVEDGPAWHGYVGVQFKALPPRRGQDVGKPPFQAFAALIELLPAGEEGSSVARQLVRSVAGPVVLQADGARRRTLRTELRALRVPEGVQPERLASVAWIEDARGRIVAFAQTRCAAP